MTFNETSRTKGGRKLGCNRCGLFMFSPTKDFIEKGLVTLNFKAYDVVQMKWRYFQKKYCNECMGLLASKLNEFDDSVHGHEDSEKDKQARTLYEELKKDIIGEKPAEIEPDWKLRNGE